MSNNNSKYNLSKDYFDLWKHCENTGGRDKDRMVTIVTWLLAFAVAILGYIITEGIKFNSLKSEQCVLVILLTTIGLGICLISLYFVYAYGSYANFYWFVADYLKKYQIGELSEIHNKTMFRKAIEENSAGCDRLSFDQRIILCLTKKEKEDFESTKGLIGIFRTMRNVILILSGIFLVILTSAVFCCIWILLMNSMYS